MKICSFFEDDNAVSTVVTAILIMAVIITFLSAINAYYLPSLAADHEIHHMQDVRNSFVELSSMITSGNPSSRVFIPLGDGGLPYISSVSSSGIITISPDGSSFNIFMEGAHSIEEQEYEIDENKSVIEQIDHVSTLSMQTDTFITNNYSVSVDENNSISVAFLNCSEVFVTTLKNGTIVFNETVLNNSYYNVTTHPNTVNLLNLDLLNPRYQFSEILSETSRPFNLTFVVGINYITATGQKNPPKTGRFHIKYDMLLDPFDINISSKCGYLRYTASNNQWLDQEYIFENGAVILKQGGNSTMRSNPFFDYNNNKVTLLLYNITGDRKSVGGNGVSIVNVLLGDENKIEYRNVSNFSIVMNTEYEEAWVNYFQMQGANVTSQNESLNIAFNKNRYNNSSDITIIMNDINVIQSS
ncbi:hypothetical protein [Methanolobus vulcani]|uniref:Archaeal Type IV pilin N-terminal domain-containing protein n=1 Tax=Methanolobus vulcani TaxID=38026 RepID=A0A7Z8KRQ1_9EURY|nr:hypothetical protein [Methanolobus vulcani]TQD29536.1 hypothetical protein FKV42_00020 [Methanolobus vulcani]